MIFTSLGGRGRWGGGWRWGRRRGRGCLPRTWTLPCTIHQQCRYYIVLWLVTDSVETINVELSQFCNPRSCWRTTNQVWAPLWTRECRKFFSSSTRMTWLRTFRSKSVPSVSQEQGTSLPLSISPCQPPASPSLSSPTWRRWRAPPGCWCCWSAWPPSSSCSPPSPSTTDGGRLRLRLPAGCS